MKKKTLYYKEGFKNEAEDKIDIDWNMTTVSDLIGEYGFRDLDFARTLGYQERTMNNEKRSCYFYECDESANINENCSPKLAKYQTDTKRYENCTLNSGMTKNPDNFTGKFDKIDAKFHGQ